MTSELEKLLLILLFIFSPLSRANNLSMEPSYVIELDSSMTSSYNLAPGRSSVVYVSIFGLTPFSRIENFEKLFGKAQQNSSCYQDHFGFPIISIPNTFTFPQMEACFSFDDQGMLTTFAVFDRKVQINWGKKQAVRSMITGGYTNRFQVGVTSFKFSLSEGADLSYISKFFNVLGQYHSCIYCKGSIYSKRVFINGLDGGLELLFNPKYQIEAVIMDVERLRQEVSENMKLNFVFKPLNH